LPAALARVWRLARKELSEILRDRRTIVTLVLMPLLLYPLLGMAFQQFLLSAAATPPVTEYRVGVVPGPGSRFLEEYRDVGKWEARYQAVAAVGLAGPPGPGPVAAAAPLLTSTNGRPAPWQRPDGKEGPHIVFSFVEDPVQAVRDRTVDMAVRLSPPQRRSPAGQGLAVDVELIYLERSPPSAEALARLEAELALANAFFLQERLRDLKVPQRATPMRVYRTAVTRPEQPETLSMAALVPLILILMTITGAVYPAIDLTAGERERGTLEILVAAPVPRLALLSAKYVAVVTVALLTAVINLVMMFLTLQLSGLGKAVFPDGGPTLAVVAAVFALLVLFALFFSAVLLVLTSFARSFKEAQAYLVPLMLLALAPGVAGLIPGLELAGLYTVVPLLNIVLLARDLLEGRAGPTTAGVVVLSTLLYAAAAIATAARVFGAEAVLYSEQGGWADLFRRPRQPRAVAPVGGALLCLALMFPLSFVLNNLIGRLALEAPNRRQILGLQIGLLALVSVALFGLLPLGSAVLGHVRLGTGFRLRRAPWAALAGGLLLGAALWPLELESLAWFREMRWAAIDPRRFEAVLGQMRLLRADYPVALVVAAFALPALAEEWFFRGYLLAALRGARPWVAVVVAAVLFGLFHFLMDAFAPERLLPSTVLGLVLGWVAYRGGSVVPAMILHACHNSALILISYTALADQDHLPWEWLLGAAGVAVVGFGLVFLGKAKDWDRIEKEENNMGAG
jgi:ABC-2 type transport system permease protein/sodium transport system permease protein